MIAINGELNESIWWHEEIAATWSNRYAFHEVALVFNTDKFHVFVLSNAFQMDNLM